MTALDTAALRDLLAKATPGPWGSVHRYDTDPHPWKPRDARQ